MKALDIQLEVSKMLIETRKNLIKDRESLEKDLMNGKYGVYEMKRNKYYELIGAYKAYCKLFDMLLDCDEINAQYEAEIAAEEEEN